MAKLTAKQELFCKEYIIDFNATQAATRAGYSKSTARQIASDTLSKIYIQSRLAELMTARNKKVEIDAQWVLTQAVKVHERCMQGEPVLDREGNETGEWKFEHAGANKSLEIIGKHVDVQAFLDRNKTEVVLTDDFSTLLKDANE